MELSGWRWLNRLRAEFDVRRLLAWLRNLDRLAVGGFDFDFARDLPIPLFLSCGRGDAPFLLASRDVKVHHGSGLIQLAGPVAAEITCILDVVSQQLLGAVIGGHGFERDLV